ncbi:hypothetical protein LTR66_003346 [Elasticomyces elasticus]|nr:hypothetical protein LTR66_003346 [Elasticomyces elasticus]
MATISGYSDMLRSTGAVHGNPSTLVVSQGVQIVEAPTMSASLSLPHFAAALRAPSVSDWGSESTADTPIHHFDFDLESSMDEPPPEVPRSSKPFMVKLEQRESSSSDESLTSTSEGHTTHFPRNESPIAGSIRTSVAVSDLDYESDTGQPVSDLGNCDANEVQAHRSASGLLDYTAPALVASPSWTFYSPSDSSSSGSASSEDRRRARQHAMDMLCGTEQPPRLSYQRSYPCDTEVKYIPDTPSVARPSPTTSPRCQFFGRTIEPNPLSRSKTQILKEKALAFVVPTDCLEPADADGTRRVRPRVKPEPTALAHGRLNGTSRRARIMKATVDFFTPTDVLESLRAAKGHTQAEGTKKTHPTAPPNAAPPVRSGSLSQCVSDRMTRWGDFTDTTVRHVDRSPIASRTLTPESNNRDGKVQPTPLSVKRGNTIAGQSSNHSSRAGPRITASHTPSGQLQPNRITRWGDFSDPNLTHVRLVERAQPPRVALNNNRPTAAIPRPPRDKAPSPNRAATQQALQPSQPVPQPMQRSRTCQGQRRSAMRTEPWSTPRHPDLHVSFSRRPASPIPPTNDERSATPQDQRRSAMRTEPRSTPRHPDLHVSFSRRPASPIPPTNDELRAQGLTGIVAAEASWMAPPHRRESEERFVDTYLRTREDGTHVMSVHLVKRSSSLDTAETASDDNFI